MKNLELKGEKYFLAIMFIFFAVLFCISTYNSILDLSIKSPYFFPMLLSLIGLVLIIALTRKANKNTVVLSSTPIIYFFSILIYAILMTFLGFYIATALFLFCITIYFNKDEKLKSSIVAIATVILIYLVFTLLFKIVFDMGMLI